MLVGAHFNVTHLLQGELAIGYLQQDYKDPAAKDPSGFATRTALQWNPDPLFTVTAAATREIRDAGVADATSYVSTGGELGVRYAIRRNIDLTLEGGYTEDSYNGIDREDHRSRVEFGAEYFANRGLSVAFEAGRYEQSSSGADAGREYTEDRAMLTFRLHR